MEKKVLLFSGGFDSTLQEFLLKPDVLLYVDMKTSYSAREIEHLKSLPKHYTDRLVIKELPLGEYERENKYLPYRNLILGTIAMQYGQHVYFGFNKDDSAPDKGKPFLNRTTKLFEILNQNAMADMNWDNYNFSFNAPFKKFSKTEMVAEVLKAGMNPDDIRNIRSCYSGVSHKGCGVCPVCLDKAEALLNNGIYKEDVFDEDILPAFEKRLEKLTMNRQSFTNQEYNETYKAVKTLKNIRKQKE